MELKIGDIVEHNGIKGKLVHGWSCDQCVFRGGECEDSDIKCYPFTLYQEIKEGE